MYKRLSAILLSLGLTIFCLGIVGARLAPTAQATPADVLITLDKTGSLRIISTTASDLTLKITASARELIIATGSTQTRLPLAVVTSRKVQFELNAAGDGFSLDLAAKEKPLDLVIEYRQLDRAIFLTAKSGIQLSSLDIVGPLTINLVGDEVKMLRFGSLAAASVAISGGGGADNLIFTDPVNVKQDITIKTSGSVKLESPVHAPGGFSSQSKTFAVNAAGIIDAPTGAVTLSAEERLTLAAGELRSGADLNLFAATIRIRDNVTQPFIAQAGGRLYLQGEQQIDIFALNHPDSALISRGNMTLRSNSAVIGDAHYLSGGQFKIEQLAGHLGDLVSPYDPVILAEGDVSLGDYTGASLHILTSGSVLLNSATIIGTDTTANTINPANGTTFNGATTLATLAGFNLSNGATVTIDGSANPTLDIRAGVNWAALGGAPTPSPQIIPPGSVSPAVSGATSAAITIPSGIAVTPPEGVVLLTNRYQSNGLGGNISVGDIDVRTVISSTNAGSITIDSRGDITTGALSAQAEVSGNGVTAGNGGPLTLLAPNGNIVTGGNIATFSRIPVNSSGAAGHGGIIFLAGAGDITINGGNGTVESFAFANSNGTAGNGGDITIETTAGNITLGTLFAQSFAGGNGSAGQGGNVTVATGGGAVNINGGFLASVQTFAQDFSNSAGHAGNVDISATNGIIVAQGIDARAPGNNSQAGNISLTTTNGNIDTGFLQTFAANASTPGAAGNVTLRALNGGIVTGDVEAYSNALFINNPAQDSGDITLEALNGDVVSGRLWAYSEARGQLGNTGNGGIIQVTATNGSITSNGEMLAYARSAINNGDSGIAGNGGSIALQATQNISVAGRLDTFSEAQVFNGEGGAAASGGPVTVTATNGRITIGGDVSAYANAKDDATGGGDITLVAVDGIDLNNGAGSVKANTKSVVGSVGNGGKVRLETVNGNLSLNSADTGATNTFGNGPAGDGGSITLKTSNGRIVVSENSFTALSSVVSTSQLAGNGGDITLTATLGISLAGKTNASARGIDGNGGDIHLTTDSGNIVAADLDASTLFSGGGSPGNGGDISLQAFAGGITTGDVDTYSNALLIHNIARNGGDISLQALNGDVTTGRLWAYSEARGAQGDTGNAGKIDILAQNGSITTNGEARADALSSINNNGSGVAGNGNDITLQATNNIIISGDVRSFSAALNTVTGGPSPTGAANNAGHVRLVAGNDITLNSIDARSVSPTTIGSGGIIEVTAGQFFRGSGIGFDKENSISTVGLANSSAITITHGGNGVIPFIVGDPANNGVAGALTTGEATLSPAQSFFFDHFEPPNLWILSIPTPAIVINEIMKAPEAVLDKNGEWIELYNAGEESFDINDCILKDNNGETHVIASDNPLLIDPGEYLVLGSNADPAANGGLAVAYAYALYSLNDASDEVILECRGLEIDRVAYDNGVTFPNPTGASMQLLDPTADNNLGPNWCEAASLWSGSAGDQGTPGETNICPTDLSLTLTVTPQFSVPGEPITYRIVYGNHGPSIADAVITYIVPAELIGVSFSSSGPPITPVDGATYVWHVPNLLPNTSGVISITGVVSPDIAPGIIFTNTATIATVADSNTANNAVEINTEVVAPVALIYLPLLFKDERITP